MPGAPVPRKDRLGLVTQWLDGTEKQLKVRPLIYMSLNFISKVLADPSVDVSVLGKWGLYIAEYGLQTGVSPTLPGPWTNWMFYQFADNTRVDGIDVDVDGDWFNGSLADLKKLGVGASVLPAALPLSSLCKWPSPASPGSQALDQKEVADRQSHTRPPQLLEKVGQSRRSFFCTYMLEKNFFGKY